MTDKVMGKNGSAEAKEGGLPNWFLIGILAIVVVAIVISIVIGQKEKYSPIVPGSRAPDFTLPDLKGRMVSLSDHRGKVVFVNFWATWCKPCREEMPSMERLYRFLKSKDVPFEILAVSIDSEGPEVVENFRKEFNLTFPILHDRKGKIKEIYKTTGVPESFIVDQKGVVAQKVIGGQDWTKPEAMGVIEALLKDGPRSPEAYRNRDLLKSDSRVAF